MLHLHNNAHISRLDCSWELQDVLSKPKGSTTRCFMLPCCPHQGVGVFTNTYDNLLLPSWQQQLLGVATYLQCASFTAVS